MRLAQRWAVVPTLVGAAAAALGGCAVKPPSDTFNTSSLFNVQAHSAALERPLQHVSLPASRQLVQEPADWLQANRDVAAFPRGHADVLRWEALQRSTPAAPAKEVQP